MKKIILSLFLFTHICFSQTNINLSNTAGWDTEPYLAINPTNPNNIVAAWMKLSGFTLAIGTSYSTDGGSTWSAPSVIPHLYPNFTSADVSLAFNSTGTLYMSFIDYVPTQDSGYVMCTRSLNGGVSWSPPVKVISGSETADMPIDRPWIAVDNSGGTYNGKLYIISKSVDIGAMPHHIWMKSSSDGGTTWSPIKLVDDSIPINLVTNAMGVPTVGADGSVYIAYVSYNPSQTPFPRMICLKSTNGGSGFIPHVIGYPVAGSAMTDTLYQGSYVISANPANANNLIFTFTDNRNGDPDILSVRSSNGGLTWTSPIRVNDDAVTNGVGQDMCWAGFSTTGKYGAAWRDRRNTGGTSSSSFEIYATVSTDGGAIFKPNQNLNSTPSPFINIQRGNDFIGVCLDDNNLYSDWCDLRTGNTDIFFNKTPMSVFTRIEESITNDDIGMKIFPNPTSGNATLQLHLRGPQYLKIDLADSNGNTIRMITSQMFNGQDQSVYIQTNGLSAGSYLIRVQSESGSVIASTLLKVER